MKIIAQDLELIEKAKNCIKKSQSIDRKNIGDIGCALITDKGNIFVGVSIICDCGIGFCAEHSAIASMIANGESKIKIIVAINSDGIILPPCGRCRELIYQVDEKNLSTEIIVRKNKTVKLKELLPDIWQKRFYEEN
jgi:cytidine deaminase